MENLTVDVIAQAFNENQELRGQILETIAQSEHGKQYLDNYANLQFEQKVGSKIGELHGEYDKNFESVLGIKRPQGEKSYNFWTNQVKSLKEKASAVDEDFINQIKKENEDLKGKIENNEQAKYFKDLYESTKKTYSEQIQEKEQLLTQFQEKQKRFSIESELNKSLAKFTINEALPEDVRSTYINTVYNSLLNEAKILEDGSIAFYANGELITNKKTMSKATAEEILSDRLKSILVDKTNAAGGGGADPAQRKPANVALSAAKNKVELNRLIEDTLMKEGVAKNSTEFIKRADELMTEYGKNLPLR
jgi:hypothetical protein